MPVSSFTQIKNCRYFRKFVFVFDQKWLCNCPSANLERMKGNLFIFPEEYNKKIKHMKQITIRQDKNIMRRLQIENYSFTSPSCLSLSFHVVGSHLFLSLALNSGSLLNFPATSTTSNAISSLLWWRYFSQTRTETMKTSEEVTYDVGLIGQPYHNIIHGRDVRHKCFMTLCRLRGFTHTLVFLKGCHY